jgi:hypothetical protein|tara:strand:+ start:4241 stop:4495 length:255 start_codon:yes stop_codon:yes gene_type:complete
MNRIEDHLLRLLLECLSAQESSIEKLNKKLEGLQELSLMNNDLLGFLAKNSSDSPIVNFNIPFSKELWEELIKYSAELEQWGKA